MSKPNWKQIRKEWENSKITFKDLAEKYNVKLGTLKSRRSREKWNRDATDKKDATPSKRSQPKREEKEPIVKSDKLTEKQRLFCIYYIKYFNATKAYRKAYKCDYMTAKTNGNRLLTNANINAEIDRMKAEQTTGLKLDVRDVLQKYIDIAFADITDFTTFGKKEIPVMTDVGPLLDEEGNEVKTEVNYVDFHESIEVDGTIIAEVKKGKDGITVKLADKMKALEMLSKYFDLLSDNDKKRLQEEKIKAETDLTNLKANQIKGETKDTSLLDALTRAINDD